ncbi:DMT family transporter [Polycladidibacter hongkongensis]|uniref:DMT family transporter n=1 Tax=Polycladidibacter hongkongensis TaxID=1647556 RepID=UPI0008373E08|nr:DMT family transporter [Pseudovibrio hongkongensis]
MSDSSASPKPCRPDKNTSRLRRLLFWQHLSGNTLGIMWALVATFLFSCMGMVIKLLGESLHVTQILAVRQGFMLLVSLPVVIKLFPASLTTKAPLLHLARTALASCTMYLGFEAVIHLPLADSTVIGFARTFFLTVFAIVLLHEKVGLHRWSATILGFLGVMLIVGATTDAGLSIYGLMALTAAAMAALVGIILRRVTQVDLPITILVFQAGSVGLVMLPFAIYNWQPISLYNAGLLIALGALSWSAQMCNIQAMKNAEATAIAPLDYTRLVYAAVISVIVFGVWPAQSTYLGAALIVAASLYTIHREAVLGRKIAAQAKANGPAGT